MSWCLPHILSYSSTLEVQEYCYRFGWVSYISSSIWSWNINTVTTAQVEPGTGAVGAWVRKRKWYRWSSEIPTVGEALRAVGQPDDVSVSFQDEDLVVTTWNWHDIATTLQHSDHHLQTTTHHIQCSVDRIVELHEQSDTSGKTQKPFAKVTAPFTSQTSHGTLGRGGSLLLWQPETWAGRCCRLSMFLYEKEMPWPVFSTRDSGGGSIIIWGAFTYSWTMGPKLLRCNVTALNMGSSVQLLQQTEATVCTVMSL